ncbi:Uncharacterised protein [uncultured archaeon]|nr:Uncharacterised protein [uncultured archaeon]
MLQDITYMLIFGKPLIFYLGLAVLLSFLATATLGYLIHTGRVRTDLKWHLRLAAFSILLALVHGALGALLYI